MLGEDFLNRFGSYQVPVTGVPHDLPIPARGPRPPGLLLPEAEGGKTTASTVPVGWGEYVDNLVRQIANGMTFGFADELAAGANSVIPLTPQAHVNDLSNQITGQSKSIYEQNLEAERSKDAAFRKDYPAAATAAELTGALLTGVPGAAGMMGAKALAAVPRLVKAAATGAAAGGVAGFGSGEGGPGSRLQNAATEAAVGGVLGVAVPYALQGAKSIMLPLVDRLWPAATPEGAALASRSAGLYNPPAKAPRPFEADYPNGAAADATGRLTADIEERPLLARTVVGRSVVGGKDQAFPSSELDPLTEAGTGQVAALYPPRALGRDVGRTVIDRLTGTPVGVRLGASLSPRQVDLVLRHEVGHVIDQLAGEIDTRGLNTELRQVYNTLNTGRERARNLTGPQHLGYSAAETPAS